MASIKVALEVGSKRIFAVALDWPGWARSGKTEDEALARLAEYTPRYAAAVREKSLRASPTLDVAERLNGDSGTDFGVPSIAPAADAKRLTDADTKRLLRLLEAAWRTFDRAADAAAGKTLRLGPRGGGRTLEKMTGHVLEAEEAYLHQLGQKRPKPPARDAPSRMRVVRSLTLETLAALSRGEEPPDPNKVHRRWTPRYHVRRSAWHALDHAWEHEDRVE
jgi:hypothetical protein